MSVANLKSLCITLDHATNVVAVSIVFNAGNVTLSGPMSFNVTALMELLSDLATDLPVIVADVMAVFGLASGQLVVPGLHGLTVTPDSTAGIITVTFLFHAASFNLGTFNPAALLKLIQDVVTDLPVIIADVEAVFAASILPPDPPAAKNY